jgi:hypothetical protein
MTHPQPSRSILRVCAAALLLLGALAVWLNARPNALATGGEPSSRALHARQPSVDPFEPALLAAVDSPAAPRGPVLAVTAPSAPLQGAEGEHPHPIDAKRQRIYRENNLHAALMGAMNVADYLGMRALLEEYRTDYPEDEHRLQAGYTLIADCLEKLTPERQATARNYWKANRGSIVRRFIRRHCLEKPLASN